MAEILWIIGDEYPTHPYLAETAEKAVSEPYPDALWRNDDSKIYHEILQEIPTNSELYPRALWRIENEKIINKLLADIPEKPMKRPYPKALWRIENGRLTHELLLEFIFLGAFENAEKLRKIVIPESVKEIGARSFSGTALKSVKISSDCEYSESSFPEGCKVEFYSE